MKFKISSFYFAICYMLLGCQALILIGHPLQIYALISVGTWGIMVAQVVAIVTLLLDNEKKLLENNPLVMVAILLLSIIIAVSLNNRINLMILTKIVTFTQLPLFLLIAPKGNAQKNKKAIYIVNFIYPVAFLFFYRSSFAYRFYGPYGETLHESLTLGYNNPNEAALYLMICFFILLSAMFYFNRYAIRLLALLEACLVGYLIYLTGSRAALILCVLIVVAMIITREYVIKPSLLLIVFLIPLFFTVLMVMFPEIAHTVVLGETIENGRLSMVTDYLSEVNLFEFLFGNFSKYNLGNLHNGMLSICASFGIGITILFFVILHYAYKNVLLKGDLNRAAYMPVALGLLAIVIYSVAEAAPFVAGSVFSASIFMLAYLAAPEKEIEKSESEQIEDSTH